MELDVKEITTVVRQDADIHPNNLFDKLKIALDGAGDANRGRGTVSFSLENCQFHIYVFIINLVI